MLEHPDPAQLTAAAPRAWLTLDRAARCSSWNPPHWVTTAARRLDRGHPLDLLIAACHPDGHVREAAVTAVDALDDTTALPVLALRAADWVPQVRERARAACARRTPVEVVTFLAPLALALERREAGRWLADAVHALLRTSPTALAEGLSSPDRRTRRAAYAVAVETGLSTEHLLRAARTDPDLPIRVLCADAAIRATGDRVVISGLLTSGTAAIRAHAVQALGDTGSAIAALSDRAAVVRATARFVLRRAGQDPATHYRSLLADGSPAVIAGLGECGDRSDTALLLPWLRHPSSRGRAETVRALRRLGHPPVDMLPLLTDPASSVTRQVATALLPHARSLDPSTLHPLLGEAPHIQTAAYRLLRAHGTWTRLATDLRLIADPDHPLHTAARADLGDWLLREAATAYTTPPSELSALLTRCEPVLGPERTRVLRFHIGG